MQRHHGLDEHAFNSDAARAESSADPLRVPPAVVSQVALRAAIIQPKAGRIADSRSRHRVPHQTRRGHLFSAATKAPRRPAQPMAATAAPAMTLHAIALRQPVRCGLIIASDIGYGGCPLRNSSTNVGTEADAQGGDVRGVSDRK